MTPIATALPPRLQPAWRRWLAVALLLAPAALPAMAQQADPPARVAYISALEGSALISTDDGNWSEASLNWPVTTGTALQLAAGSRTALDGGGLSLRLQGAADLATTTLDDTTAQWALTSGSASLRLRQLQAGERVEIDTPQLALVASQAGTFRLDVDPRAGTTRVTVHAGSAIVYGAAGQSMPLASGQQVVFSERDLRVLASTTMAPVDAFDQWTAWRDQQREQSPSAAHLPPDMPGYPLLDSHGTWAQDASHGAVWFPTITITDWAPYRFGRWTWIAPWGWTWIDDAPWGFAPFHYGRWTQIGLRWAWVPGPVRRPVYAPALVAFVGSGNVWFPLAPGEDWHPPYRVSPRYRQRLNDWGTHAYPRPPGGNLHFQQHPGAMSYAPHGLLGDGSSRTADRRPRFSDASTLDPGWIRNHRIGTPPPRPAPQPRRFTPPAQAHGAPAPAPTPGWATPSPRPRGDDAHQGQASRPQPGQVAPPLIRPAPPPMAPQHERPLPGQIGPGESPRWQPPRRPAPPAETPRPPSPVTPQVDMPRPPPMLHKPQMEPPRAPSPMPAPPRSEPPPRPPAMEAPRPPMPMRPAPSPAPQAAPAPHREFTRPPRHEGNRNARPDDDRRGPLRERGPGRFGDR